MSNQLGRSVQLVDLVSEVTSGVTPQAGSARYYTDEGYLFAKIDDLTAADGKTIESTFLQVKHAALQGTGLRLYPTGTILLSMYGTVGQVKVTTCELTGNQALAALLPPFRCDPSFLYHYLVWVRPYWDRSKAQTTQANINGTTVKSLPIRLPSSLEQRQIAETLDTLDDQISTLERIIRKFEQCRMGLIHDALREGDLDQVTPLGSLADVTAGVTLGSRLSGPGTVSRPYLRVANVQDGHLDLNEIKSVRVRQSDLHRFELKPGDVLMNEGGDADKLGRGAVWEGQIPGCLHQNHVFRVRCHLAKLIPQYLSLVSGSAHGKRYFLSASKQTTNLATINSRQIKQFPVPLCSLDRQLQIAETAAAITAKIETERSCLVKARLLKAGLMTDLLSGRIQVPQEVLA